jgi:hypothetical protein
MSDITDEMFDAACESAGVSQTGYAPWKDNLRGAIAAALAAAPIVDYGEFGATFRSLWACGDGGPTPVITDQDSCRLNKCPHPHYSLIVGQEFTL